uniref:Uncharacterized protein n=1 Tax=Escherichia coli TaxID=562 RepID=A0A7D7PVQ8_ECOLX|nr:hypothetical protein [Escherichia coli]
MNPNTAYGTVYLWIGFIDKSYTETMCFFQYLDSLISVPTYPACVFDMTSALIPQMHSVAPECQNEPSNLCEAERP